MPRYLAAVLLILLFGCGEATVETGPQDTAKTQETRDDAATSTTARQPRSDLLATLREDQKAVRHASDGKGRAWLESGDNPVVAGGTGRWTLIFEVAEPGIVEGGLVFLQVSPFWGWSTPQVVDPSRPGFTEVTLASDSPALEGDVKLDAQTVDQQLLAITVRGRALEAGERIRLVYGAGEAGAIADRFAERDSRFYFAVDGNGDGVRQLVDEAPGVEVVAGPPAKLLLTLPSTARPGERVRLNLALVDALGNAGHPYAGTIEIENPPSGLEPVLTLQPEDQGRRAVEFTVGETGILRLTARSSNGLAASSNPMQVARQAQAIFWGDLQNHSNLSDGTALPEDLFAYARDVAALDVFALTDHDHWGMRFLDQNEALWQRIQQANERFHEPGRFVTILGYEWTSWVHGHRHVLFFDSAEQDHEIFSSVSPQYETPQQLWTALRGHRALTIAHHSAGGPIATDWTVPPDPEFEPVTEIVSVHGSSEAMDSPGRIYNPVPGNFVRDALNRGYELGFLGSSDGHDGHPGLGHLASPTGGLAAILSEDLTRDSIYQALKARRVYATSGPRIILRTSFGGYRMGDIIPADEAARARLEGTEDAVPGLPPNSLVAQVYAPSEISHIDLIRTGQAIERLDCEARLACAFGVEFAELKSGEYIYLRVVQGDGGLAWSSPFFFE